MQSELIPTILFEDPHLVVLSKPAGLLSQGEVTGDDNLVDWLRGHFGRKYVGLVHRLDRNTSGIMIVAKRTKSAQRLTDSLQEGKIQRNYQAWLEGRLETAVRWEHLLLKDADKNVVKVVRSNPKAQKAILHAVPLQQARYQGLQLTLAEIELETGRSHQIRAQAAHEGYPLLGDVKYGSNSASSRKFGRPALHSHRLKFPHPMTEAEMSFEAPLPPDMRSLLS
ncbi:MAG: RluA family pseudouridine synthase [Methylotenera sp.]|nr:RluA family pseudouridine synthase [Oligoflexia bacterium]